MACQLPHVSARAAKDAGWVGGAGRALNPTLAKAAPLHLFAESSRRHQHSAAASGPDFYARAQGEAAPPPPPASQPPDGAPASPGGERKGGRWGPAKGIEELGPELPCSSETDIFEALGLAYVPLWMRTDI